MWLGQSQAGTPPPLTPASSQAPGKLRAGTALTELVLLPKEDDNHLHVFCELLGLERGKVAQWLCHRKIVTASETVVKPMTRPQAVNARDALAKKIYAHLFDFVVDRINQALQFSGKKHTFIGVLDIYG